MSAEQTENSESVESVAGGEESHGDADFSEVRVLGVERYVQAGFGVLGVVIFWLLSKTTVLVWNYFGEPNTFAVSGICLVLAGVLTWVIYRNETVHTLAHEIGIELSKVTWPTREELKASVIVVLITSAIASLYTGALDFVWSAVTDLIYKL